MAPIIRKAFAATPEAGLSPREPLPHPAQSSCQSSKWLIDCDEQTVGDYQPHRHLDFEAIFVEECLYSCKVKG